MFAILGYIKNKGDDEPPPPPKRKSVGAAVDEPRRKKKQRVNKAAGNVQAPPPKRRGDGADIDNKKRKRVVEPGHVRDNVVDEPVVAVGDSSDNNQKKPKKTYNNVLVKPSKHVSATYPWIVYLEGEAIETGWYGQPALMLLCRRVVLYIVGRKVSVLCAVKSCQLCNQDRMSPVRRVLLIPQSFSTFDVPHLSSQCKLFMPKVSVCPAFVLY